MSRICLACTRTERTCVWPDTPSTASHSDKPTPVDDMILFSKPMPEDDVISLSKPMPEDDVISLSSGSEGTRPSKKAKAGAHSCATAPAYFKATQQVP